jgi:hypothetical protein
MTPAQELQRLDAFEQRMRDAVARKWTITKRNNYGIWFALPHHECVLLADCMAKANELRSMLNAN